MLSQDLRTDGGSGRKETVSWEERKREERTKEVSPTSRPQNGYLQLPSPRDNSRVLGFRCLFDMRQKVREAKDAPGFVAAR